MKRIYFLLFFCLFFIKNGNSQIIDVNHPTLNYAGSEFTTLTAHAEIINNGPNTLDVLCERYLENLTPNHFSYFCWIVCYDTSTDISPTPITLGPGASTNTFEGWLVPSNLPGHDEVTYRYYDQSGNSDTLYLTFTYDFGPTGIRNVQASKYSLNIVGPNPASTNTTFSYTISGGKQGVLLISNLLGSKVSEIRLNGKSNTQTVPVSELKSGIYMCSLIVDGSIVSSKKLIVSHR